MKKCMIAVTLVAVLAGTAFAGSAPKAEVTQYDYVYANRQTDLRRAKLKEAAPEVMNASGALGKAALKDGALSNKTKELIAVALSLSAHCEGCINSHVKNAIRAQVTREELVEVLGVCILMGGGPSSVYANMVLEVYDQYMAQQAK